MKDSKPATNNGMRRTFVAAIFPERWIVLDHRTSAQEFQVEAYRRGSGVLAMALCDHRFSNKTRAGHVGKIATVRFLRIGFNTYQHRMEHNVKLGVWDFVGIYGVR
jgi:hypothetical protein